MRINYNLANWGRLVCGQLCTKKVEWKNMIDLSLISSFRRKNPALLLFCFFQLISFYVLSAKTLPSEIYDEKNSIWHSITRRLIAAGEKVEMYYSLEPWLSQNFPFFQIKTKRLVWMHVYQNESTQFMINWMKFEYITSYCNHTLSPIKTNTFSCQVKQDGSKSRRGKSYCISKNIYFVFWSRGRAEG